MHFSEEKIEKDLQKIATHRDKNERLSFKRKMIKMETIVKTLEPIDEKILELMAEKQPILDEIQELRYEMVKECVHPKESLVHYGTHVVCKFCEAKISVKDER